MPGSETAYVQPYQKVLGSNLSILSMDVYLIVTVLINTEDGYPNLAYLA